MFGHPRGARIEDTVEEHVLAGFDDASEPQVRQTEQGRLWLGVEFLPPSWARDEDSAHPIWDKRNPWADFGERLTQATGVPVVWEDREWFRIDHPRADTVQTIHQFLLAERERLDPTPPEAKQLDAELRRWSAGAVVLREEDVAAKKARLRQLAPRMLFRIFPDELLRRAEPGAAPDTAM